LESCEGEEGYTPLFICPGLSEPAEDYINLMHSLAPRKCIAMSFRGRGRSDCPAKGYSLEEHESDIEAVVRHLEIKDFCLMGYSRGVSYTLAYGIKNNPLLKGLIIEEYPPVHKKMSEGWAEELYKAYPDYRLNRRAAIGIQQESVQVDFSSSLQRISCPVLVMRGMQDSSQLTGEAAAIYSDNLADCKVMTFENAGHDIQTDDFRSFLEAIKAFLVLVDKRL
ncbi:MAG TPA: alpha/beta hydrolase, partial [Negativicutes bacterium]|nr:alpha/beta hydrolase [Negativicutes bacterium]